MSIKAKFSSIEHLTPVSFAYKGTLDNQPQMISGYTFKYENSLAFSYNELTQDLVDVTISKDTLVGLTPIKKIKHIFENTISNLQFGTFPTCFYLTPKNKPQNRLKVFNDILYVGGIGKDALFTVIPYNEEWQEIRLNADTFLQISKTFPYTASFSKKPLPRNEIYQKLFKVRYENGYINIQTLTNDGLRYISFDINNNVGAFGLCFNEVDISSVSFNPTFISRSNFNIGYDPLSVESQYYNSFDQKYTRGVNLQQYVEADTNHLMICSLDDVLLNKTPYVNLAQLRTNFNETGTFKPKI